MKINGFEYAWEDVQCSALGGILDTLTEIEYTTKKDHTNGYGRGDKPVRMNRGRKEFDAKIVVSQGAAEAMQRTLPRGKDLTDIKPFPIVVAYAPEGGIITTDVIELCRIKEIKKGMKEGDGEMLCELSLAVGNIKYNV